MEVTIEQLEEWIASTEDEHLEFKEAKRDFKIDRISDYAVALGNEGGGKLILGVSDKMPRQVVGTLLFRDLNDLKTKVFDKVYIRIQACEVKHPKGRVLVFEMPGRAIASPKHNDGRYLMRVGDGVRGMSLEQLREILNEGRPDFLSEVAVMDLSEEAVLSMLDTEVYFKLLEKPYPSAPSEVLHTFVCEKLINKRNGKYDILNLGALLFAKKLADFQSVSDRNVRITVWDGNDMWTMKSDVFSPEGYVVGFEKLIEYIHSRLPKNEVIGKAFRETAPMFPDIAIRELVANALVHQDFHERGMLVAVDIFSDRVTIGNPGKCPIATDRLVDSYQSRNEQLADLMRRLRICERAGSGIDKVIRSCEMWQLPAPDFRNGDKHFSALLFSHIPFANMDRKDKVRACFQHCALKWVMTEKMSNQSLRERFGLEDGQVEIASGIIKLTAEEGLIKLDSPDSTSRRYARYVPYWA